MADSAETAELEELRQRLALLEEGAAQPRNRHRVRSFCAVLLILLACVLTPLSAVAAWTNSQVGDTDRYLATVTPLAENPAVRAAVTDRVTTEIMKYLPVGTLLDEVTPDQRPLLDAALGRVSSAITDGLTGFVHNQVERVVDSDAFVTVWVAVNRNAHAAVDRILTGQGGGAVQAQGDTVTLDLAPLIDQVKNRLVADGLGIASKIPEIHTDFVLVQSDAIPKARTAFRLLDLAGFWLPVLTVLCAAAGVLLAGRRRRALVTAALGVAAGAALLGLGLTVFRALYQDRLPAGVNQDAATAVYDALVHYLRATVRAVVVLGLLVAFGAWVSGGGRWAGTVRGFWAAGFGAVRGVAGKAGLRLGPVGRFVHRFKGWLTGAVLTGFVLAFLLWSYPTGAVVLWLGVGLLGALAVLELLDDRPDATV
ncbi:hypothetical protein F4556_003882 [Kitasatospora gansuensis]|uniref:Integral membrane protein n=1 Tax=Kitasatospora gansuensis TaxID=258050 RepID=A0A7W7SDL9_9ACTN|nr:hypothetical protein [Kitasatospora gansuensis]MBB4948347.1 hypothetical protein [Kitasatospora gansuensis]